MAEANGVHILSSGDQLQVSIVCRVGGRYKHSGGGQTRQQGSAPSGGSLAAVLPWLCALSLDRVISPWACALQWRPVMCIRSAACKSIAGWASLSCVLGGGGHSGELNRLLFGIPVGAEAWDGCRFCSRARKRSREGLS